MPTAAGLARNAAGKSIKARTPTNFRKRPFVGVIVTGIPELDRALKKLDQRGMTAITRAAVRAGTAVAVKGIKKEAQKHKDTGTFWKSIGIRGVGIDKRHGDMVGRAGPRGRFRTDRKTGAKKQRFSTRPGSLGDLLTRNTPGKYATFIEYGSQWGGRIFADVRRGLFQNAAVIRSKVIATVKVKLPIEVAKYRSKKLTGTTRHWTAFLP